MARDLLGIDLRHLAHSDRSERAVLELRQVRKQVEVLEHHSDLAAHFVDTLEILGELGAIDDDAAALPVFDAVDTAKQRRLAAARRAADDDALAAHHLEIDLAQHMEAAEPFVETDDVDRDLVRRGAHIEAAARARSVRSPPLLAAAQCSTLPQCRRPMFKRRSTNKA